MGNMQRQYAINAAQLWKLADKARGSKNGRANGQTVAYFEEKAAAFERLSTASDDDLRAHFRQLQAGVTARLAEIRAAQ
jgi:hypothetical protein